MSYDMLCPKCGKEEIIEFESLCPVCDIYEIYDLSVEFGFDSPYEDEWEDEYDWECDFGYMDDIPAFPNTLLEKCPHCHIGKMLTGGDGNYCNVCNFYEPIT